MGTFDEQTDNYACFSYLTAPNRALYEAVLRLFDEARQRYELHLRPGDIVSRLEGSGQEGAEVEAALEQLCRWGNLQSYADSTHVHSVEDFYRRRLFYQLTEAGVAVNRSVREFARTIATPASLQRAALASVRDRLSELVRLVGQAEASDWEESSFDVAKADSLLQGLFRELDRVTDQAQQFFRNLQATVELRDVSVATFLAFKERLIYYLQRFLDQVVQVGREVEAVLEELAPLTVTKLLSRIAEYRTVDEIDAGAERLAEVKRSLTASWTGLVGWFRESPLRRSQSEELRTLARIGIREIAATVHQLMIRRDGSADRVADLRRLACWFAECEDDRQAHSLWRSLFCLSPARHLTVSEETLHNREQSPVPSDTSWSDAPPLQIAPSLRKYGRSARGGKTPALIDNRQQLAELAAASKRESEQLEMARATLFTHGRRRLSELANLDCRAFPIFLDLLGDALVVAGEATEEEQVTSSDGSLCIALRRGDANSIAEVKTTWGTFSGHNFWISIESATGGGAG